MMTVFGSQMEDLTRMEHVLVSPGSFRLNYLKVFSHDIQKSVAHIEHCKTRQTRQFAGEVIRGEVLRY